MKRIYIMFISWLTAFISLTKAGFAIQPRLPTLGPLPGVTEGPSAFSEGLLSIFYAFGGRLPPDVTATIMQNAINAIFLIIVPVILVMVILYDILAYGIRIFKSPWTNRAIAVLVAVLLIPVQGLTTLIAIVYAAGATGMVLGTFILIMLGFQRWAVGHFAKMKYVGTLGGKMIRWIVTVAWAGIFALAGSLAGLGGILFGFVAGAAFGYFSVWMERRRYEMRLGRIKRTSKVIDEEIKKVQKGMGDIEKKLEGYRKEVERLRSLATPTKPESDRLTMLEGTLIPDGEKWIEATRRRIETLEREKERVIAEEMARGEVAVAE